MSLVVLEEVSLGFGERQILDRVDLRVAERDRIGLVGPNGSGKTTLLRLLAGEIGCQKGHARSRRGLRLGYLPQDAELSDGGRLLPYVLASVPGRAELEREVEAAEAELELAARLAPEAREQAQMAAAERIADAQERLAHFEVDYSEHRAARILSGLGFSADEHDRDLSELSGGWRMRASLAALLFQAPDLLLLDEPTNYLDMPSVAWFGGFLRGYRHAFVLVCHDREFLNEQIERVVSFESEGVRQYRGDYEHYRRQRREEEVVLSNKARNLQRERERAEKFIDRFRSQANKAKAVQSRIKALERMESVATHETGRDLSFRFPPTARCGSTVVTVAGVQKAFADVVVFPGLDLTVQRGEKIGIIGINGAGKTTLLKMIAGELEADAGSITLGHNVEPGYYAQHHAETLDPHQTVYESVAALDPSAGMTRVRTLLGAFLFSGDDVDKPVRVLSGGERSRVALARLLMRPGNLLLMDEPTNHLDLESSESLAEALTTFDGTLLFVSHNRSFVRRLATRIWDVAAGAVETYPGTLDEYLERARDEGEPPAAPEPEPAGASERHSARSKTARKRDRQAARSRKREEADRRAERGRRLGPLIERVAELEREIERLEQLQRRRSVELADPELLEDERRRRTLLTDYQRDASELEERTAEWEVAQAELEAARQ